MRIIVFWDSIWEWFYDYKKWGWGNRLKLHFFKKGTEIEVTNASIAGYTSKNILDHFENILQAFTARQEGKEKETDIIFAIGINDSCFFDKNCTKQNVTLKDFETNIRQILQLALSKTWVKRIYFINNILVDESKLNPACWGEYYYKNSEIKKYNEVLQNITKEYNLPLIDIENLIEKENLPDGIHPNAKGHKNIYRLIKKNLWK